MAELSQADKDRARAAIHERAEFRAVQPRRWTEELGRLAGEVIARRQAPDVDKNTAFWLRLWGVLVEGGEYYEELYEFHRSIGTTTTPIGRDTLAVLDAIKAVRAAFDDDERIWIHYRRDTECHLVPESYDLSVNKKAGKLKDTRTLALVGKDLTVDFIDERSRALLRKHGVCVNVARWIADATHAPTEMSAAVAAVLTTVPSGATITATFTGPGGCEAARHAASVG